MRNRPGTSERARAAAIGVSRLYRRFRGFSFPLGRAAGGLASGWLCGHLLLAVAFAQETQEPSAPPIDPARRTPTVRLIERCLPSVVAIRAFSSTDKPNEERINLGSGAIIHPAGYIITNFHILNGAKRGEAALPGGGVYPYSLIAGFAHEDLGW